MHVTIITDASFDSNHLVGGYGYWIACERGKQPGEGPFRGLVTSSTIAEMMAICRALHDGVRLKLIEAGDEILIQTDCMGAIECLQRPGSSPSCTLASGDKTVWDVFDKLRRKHKLIIRFRHVKGHTNIQESRYAANRACDLRAKKAMRLERTKRIAASIASLRCTQGAKS